MLGLAERRLLGAALADDDTPTAGYLFNDIASMCYYPFAYCVLTMIEITHQSVSDCQALEDRLLRELEKGSSRVKLKALKVTLF